MPSKRLSNSSRLNAKNKQWVQVTPSNMDKPLLQLGIKHDQGKARYDLIPPLPERALAELFTMGGVIHGDRNWEKGLQYSRLYSAMRRHLNAFWSGETYDPKDGQHHLTSVAWGAFALLHFELTGQTHLDDRPKTEVKKNGKRV